MTHSPDTVEWALTGAQRETLLPYANDLPALRKAIMAAGQDAAPKPVSISRQDIMAVQSALAESLDPEDPSSPLAGLFMYTAFIRYQFDGADPRMPEELGGAMEQLTVMNPAEVALLFEANAFEPEMDEEDWEEMGDTPVEGLNGLTMNEVSRLLATPVAAPGHPLQLLASAPGSAVAKARVLHNVLVVVRAVQARGSVSMTDDGELPEDFVKAVLPDIEMDTDLHPPVSGLDDPAESAHFSLFFARVVAMVADLMVAEDYGLVVTQTGTDLTAEGNAGALYAHLCGSLLNELDMCAFDDEPESPEVQMCMPFALYGISQLEEGWHPIEEVYLRLLLPPVVEDMIEQGNVGDLAVLVEYRIVQPLCEFGLIALDFSDESAGKIAKTPLFDQVIAFEF